jgi:intracellular sulfur oxidation DsrE/DsrF family protein
MYPTIKRSLLALSIVLGCSLAVTSAVGADTTFETPTIQGAGKIRATPARDTAYQPDVKGRYKAVFNMTNAAPQPDQVNHGLQQVARAVNLYTDAGVALKRLDFVVIISGKATLSVLDDARYQTQFGVDNPNLPVIEQLRQAGVDVAVCSQAVAILGYADEDVDENVKLALSALTTVIDLQQQGYALVPL